MPLRTSIVPRQGKNATCQRSFVSQSAMETVEVSPLGNSGKSASPHGKQKEREERKEGENKKESVKARFALQNGAKYLLRHNKALQGCCAWLQYGQDGVSLISYPELKKARFGGLQTCASVWACPICAAKISERRRLWELAPAIAKAKEKGWSVLLVSYTRQHGKEDQLSLLLEGLKTARKRSRSGKRWDRLKRKHNIVGSVRAFEVTHGRNGWHPHFHELIFIDGVYDRVALVADLRRQWDDGIRVAGLNEVNEHGVDVSDTYARVEEYVTKWGHDPKWGIAEEMSKQQVKKARSEKGRSPFQLLSAFTLDGDAQAGALFREYADAMKGERQLYWSPGLKLLLGVQDLSDKQLEAQEDQNKLGITMDILSDPEYRCICADDRRGDLWCIVADGDKAALDNFLAPYRSMRVNKPAGITMSVQLLDRSADERDMLLPLVDPFASDWLVQQIAEIMPDASQREAKDMAKRLYARKAKGENLPIFRRQMEYREMQRQEVQDILMGMVRAEAAVTDAPQAGGAERQAMPPSFNRLSGSRQRGCPAKDCLTLPGLC